MAGKGSPKGVRQGGRQKGTPNRATLAQRQRAAASGLLPHEFLLAVSRGEAFDGHVPTFGERLDAAAKAAPFFAPRLASVDVQSDATVRHVISDTPLSPEQRDAEWLEQHGGSLQ